MYLGQESWSRQGAQGAKGGQKGAQPFQLPPQPPRPVQHGGAMKGGGKGQQMMGGAASNEVGQAPRFTITGNKDAVVGPIVRGDFIRNGANHGKPSYKKTTMANGLAVLIYFWDERDGAANSGWWIGPEIGGNMVWGHHPNRSSATPPTTGWQAPHSGPPDPSMRLNAPGGGGGAPPVPAPPMAVGAGQAQWQKPPQFQQQQQQQQQQQHQQQQQQQQQKQQQQQQAQQQRLQAAQQAQQQRLQAQQKQQQEAQAKAAAKAEEMKQKQAEQQAAMTIRKVVGRVRNATPETIDKLKEELSQVLSKEIAKCGASREKVQEEADKALEAADKKVEDIKERREKADEARKENEKKRAEAAEKAIALIGELTELADGAEAAAKELETAVEAYGKKSGLDSAEKAQKAAAPVEKIGEAAAKKVAECTEFLQKHSGDFRSLPPASKPPAKTEEGKDKEEEKEEKPTAASLPKLQRRVTAARASVDKETRALKAAVQAAAKKAVASQEVKKIHTVFAKYDKDKDGMLNRKEIVAFAKTEYSFTVPDTDLDTMLKAVGPDSKGVKETDFHRLKVALGVARERAKDKDRKAAREAHEKQLAERKASLQAKSDEVSTQLKGLEVEVQEASKSARMLPAEAKTSTSIEMLDKAEKAAASLKAVSDKISAAAKAAAAFSAPEDLEKELKHWFDAEKKKLQSLAQILDSKMNAVTSGLDRVKADAERKEAVEAKKIATKAIMKLKKHMADSKLSGEALFEAIDKKKTGSFTADAFAAFVGKLPKAEGETEEISEADLKRAFADLDEEKAGKVVQSTFEARLMVLMKVVKDVALTGGLDIKDAKTVRRLEAGEVVQMLEGPVKEEAAEVQRIRAKAMQDGVEGWVTIAGNQGSLFLKEGVVFKVIKDTILTETFDIEASKEDTRKIKESTRKLKPGEILELREWAKKQEETGLTRMKCKVKSDGAIGYVTTVGNTGIKFVEVL